MLPVQDGEQWADRYEVLTEIASGGMATVYLARLGGAGGFQRLFAIKRLHPHLAREREFVDMFLDEARLAARIHHPNVVPILEVGTSPGGHFYLVMEYIQGESLARLLSRTAGQGKPIPTRVAIKVVLDALYGLDAAHELVDDYGAPLNLVHRDVSPQNILVGSDGTSRITDFGVARAATRLTTTRAGQLKGKLGYMAPEQAQGEDIDRRADLFAMGVILWESLVGRRLFKDRSDAHDAQTLNRLLYQPIPRLSEVDPSVHAGFDEVCQRALERDSRLRFSTCAEFAEALEQAAQHACGIGSPREVAAFVDQVAGPELAELRDAIRNWAVSSQISRIDRLDSRTPSGPSTASPIHLVPRASPAGLGIDNTLPEVRPARRRSRTTIVALVVACISLLVAAGALSLSHFRSSRAAGDVLAPPVPTASEKEVVVPVVPAVVTTALELPTPAPVEPEPSSTAMPVPSGSTEPVPGPLPTPADLPIEPEDPDDLNVNPYR